MSTVPASVLAERSSGDQKTTEEDLKCVPLELLAERHFTGIWPRSLIEMEGGQASPRRCSVFEDLK